MNNKALLKTIGVVLSEIAIFAVFILFCFYWDKIPDDVWDFLLCVAGVLVILILIFFYICHIVNVYIGYAKNKQDEKEMTNQEKFIEVFGEDAWKQMVSFSGTAEQFKEFWTSSHKAQ